MKINDNEAYFLGLIYSKGDILEIDNNNVIFKINIKFRRPNDEALRSDNIYTARTHHMNGKEKLVSRFSNDFFILKSMLTKEFGIQFDILTETNNSIDWSKKSITIISESVKNTDIRFIKLFQTDKITNKTLNHFPFTLEIYKSKRLSLSFIQGVCDGCSLVPNEASSQNGGTGAPRIQLEPNQSRWELCVGLCQIFQEGLNIRVNNINWGHPQIRTSWIGQNHQFRVLLSDIPTDIELYRMAYKREEYHKLYKRQNIQYNPSEYLCPLKKRTINRGMNIYLYTSKNNDLNSDLLDERLKGISINEPNKKSIIVCYLLGCERCRKYINIYLDDKLI